MAILDEIMTGPNDIAALKKTSTSTKSLLDNTFLNFLAYAKKNWSYTASSKSGGEHLMNGTATSAPCGGIATALKMVFSKGLNIDESRIGYIRVIGYVWTDPAYLCFDPKVRGNLRPLETPGAYQHGCIFNEHYYLRCEGSYYDPCLSSTYATEGQSVKDSFSGAQIMNVGSGMGRKLLKTSDHRNCVLYMPNETVPGFTGAWCIFAATKKNMEKALGKAEFQKEMATMGGNSTFARFVKSLH